MKYYVARTRRENEIKGYSINIPSKEYTEVLTIKGFKDEDKVPKERIITFDCDQVIAVLNILDDTGYSYRIGALS